MVVRLSDRVEVEWFRQVGPIRETEEDEIAVSGIGTIAAARVIPRRGAAVHRRVHVRALDQAAPVHRQPRQLP